MEGGRGEASKAVGSRPTTDRGREAGWGTKAAAGIAAEAAAGNAAAAAPSRVPLLLSSAALVGWLGLGCLRVSGVRIRG